MSDGENSSSSKKSGDIVDRIIAAEFKLKETEKENIKLIMEQKELNKKFEELDTEMKETKLKLLTARGQLKAKEQESKALKAKVGKVVKPGDMDQKIAELKAELEKKDGVFTSAWRNASVKQKQIKEAKKKTAETVEDVNIMSQKLKALEIENSFVSKIAEECDLAKSNNIRMAEIIFKYETNIAGLEE
jgi:chromosome segregation ATPase